MDDTFYVGLISVDTVGGDIPLIWVSLKSLLKFTKVYKSQQNVVRHAHQRLEGDKYTAFFSLMTFTTPYTSNTNNVDNYLAKNPTSLGI